ncbi:MAG: 4Fe-4S binding protein [Planctomycetota bacterium]
MEELLRMLTERGATLVGFADLRGVPAEVRAGLPRGVSLAVALDPEIIADIQDGPTPEYMDLYHRANEFLTGLAEAGAAFLRERGHRAEGWQASGGIDGQTLSVRTQHKTLATRAGLGWVGKCALLVTEHYGSAVRFASILTDAELPVGEPVDESRCGECAACVEVCPGDAPQGPNWRVGMERAEIFDAFACARAMRERRERAGDDIGICGMSIAACPYTRDYLRRSGVNLDAT